MSLDRPNLWRILSDASRVIGAHSGHFFALSALFIFPNSLAAAVYTLLSNPLETLYLRLLALFATAEFEVPAIGESQFLLQFLLYIASLCFSTCAISSIVASTFNGFYGKPVEFISALRSVLLSFLPVLATTLLAQLIIVLIVLAFAALLFLANNALASIGFDMDYYHNEYFLVLCIAIGVAMAAAVIYLQIEWSLSSAVVVLKSDWGFAALKRSSYLLKGARGVMFVFTLFYGVLGGVLAIWFVKFVMIGGGSDYHEWIGWLVVKTIVYACLSTLLSLYVVAAVAVFFIYCKASRHELEFEIDPKLAGEYLRLPYDVIVF